MRVPVKRQAKGRRPPAKAAFKASPIRNGATPLATASPALMFAVAASANFPALLLALTWRRFNTTGAVVGVLTGVVSSVALVVMSPPVWAGPDSQGGALPFYSLSNPGIVSIPLGFLGCYIGTLLGGRERDTERNFDELWVRSETGLGSEGTAGQEVAERKGAAVATATQIIK